MKKVLFVGSMLLSSLLADNSLGTPIGNDTINQVIEKQTITTQTIEQQRATPIPQTSSTYSSTQTPTYTKSYTKTVVQNSNSVTNNHTFKKDHHRYDKRYQNFDYDNQGYYNDDGYYYGYYDHTGYFYNNIFFTYSTLYSYNDRRYHRDHFSPRHHHYRTYRHHRINDWNRIHCYREPNHIVYGDYYDRSYYPRDRSTYYQNDRYRNHAYMTTPRRNYNHNQVDRDHTNRIYNNHTTRDHNHYNSRNYSNRNNYYNRDSYRNSYRDHGARMEIPKRNINRNSRSRDHSSSRPKRSSTAHMQLAR